MMPINIVLHRTLPTAALILVACQGQPEVRLEDFRGASVTPKVPKIDFTLTDQSGTPFSFGAETDGHATLLFFGYTHCPDICPIHMSQIAAALRQVDEAVADQVRVVFVSVDPERDTPERLAQWLGAFDSRFIGLTGPIEEINQILIDMRFRPGAVAAPDSAGNYGVSHASAVIGYTRDNVGRFLYMGGTRTEDYVHDIPLLVAYSGDE